MTFLRSWPREHRVDVAAKDMTISEFDRQRIETAQASLSRLFAPYRAILEVE